MSEKTEQQENEKTPETKAPVASKAEGITPIANVAQLIDEDALEYGEWYTYEGPEESKFDLRLLILDDRALNAVYKKNTRKRPDPNTGAMVEQVDETKALDEAITESLQEWRGLTYKTFKLISGLPPSAFKGDIPENAPVAYTPGNVKFLLKYARMLKQFIQRKIQAPHTDIAAAAERHAKNSEG